MKKRPAVNVTHARRICETLGCRAVIVIALDREGFASASYGDTKLECRQTAQTLNAIAYAIETGQIPVWGEKNK